MKLNFVVKDFILNDSNIINDLISFLNEMQCESYFMDDIIINLYVENEYLLKKCLDVLKKYRFGIFKRLPLVNLYFDLEGIYVLKDIHNDIHNHITPLLVLEQDESILDKVKEILPLFLAENWEIKFIMNIYDESDFVNCIKLYDMLKCQFCEKEISIIFNMAESESILKYAYKNIEYVVDSVNFLGLRNNKIVDCLLKVFRERESAISQNYDESYRDTIEQLMQYETINLYDNKSLVRKTMDDFAMI